MLSSELKVIIAIDNTTAIIITKRKIIAPSADFFMHFYLNFNIKSKRILSNR
jgi:hypothetical protein